MTIEDAMKAFAAIEGLDDGTQAGRDKCTRLVQALIENPETFWDVFFDTVNADDPIRMKAEALLRDGTVNEKTTFAGSPGIAEKIKRDGDDK